MSWLVDVEFRRSPRHGLGAFARRRIAAGTQVWRFDASMKVGGLVELAALEPDRLRFALHGGYLHHPTDRFVWYEDGMQFVNHADAPVANIGITEWTPLEEDNCAALRDIEPGEELLEDYTFWSVLGLPHRHWLRMLYADFHPEHFAFLASLEPRRAVAA